MGRLTLDVPAALGDEGAGTNGDRTAYDWSDEVDPTTAQFLRWFDCWAGR